MSSKMKKKTSKNSKVNKKKSAPALASASLLPSRAITLPAWGIIMLLLTAILTLSLLSFSALGPKENWLGLVGYFLGWSGHALFGLTSYLFCCYLAWIGWRWLMSKNINNIKSKSASMLLLLSSVALLLSLIEDRTSAPANWIWQTFYPGLWKHKLFFHFGGAPIFYLYRDMPHYNLLNTLNGMGTFLVALGGLLISSFILGKIEAEKILETIRNLTKRKEGEDLIEKSEEINGSSTKKRKIKEEESPFSSLAPKEKPFDAIPLATYSPIDMKLPEPLLEEEFFEENSMQKSSFPLQKEEKRLKALEQQRVYNGDFASYQLPSSSLLTPPKKNDQSQLKKDLKRQAEILEQTLLNFGIEAKVGQINCGPTITSFELHPAVGVKVQKIKALENDIALNLKARSTRIIAPIPGKAAVGIEVPNSHPQEVGFKELLQAYQQKEEKFRIPMLLGKAVNGDFVMSDLTKMPHCIIAGATGSGKSVCINTIVMSIVLSAKPDEIKMVMIDPKKVELTPYTRLPHMLAPVITEPAGACAALNWLVKEMEKRYELLKMTGVRNIESFNQRVIDKEKEEKCPIEIPEKLPFIVVIIDELADLMMVSSSDIETPIARLAQMARAVGIHQILATQRPSREVITGLIKANFPARIAFKVASRVNSQIILDESGAETLLGNGDMLFLPPGTSHCMRAQGAYIRDKDINVVVDSICQQAPPNYLIASFDTMKSLLDSGEEEALAGRDTLYQDAYDIVLSTGNASTTFLQRKLKIGYARAASLMDQLEKNGVVTAADGSKARKILVRRPGKEKKEGSDSPQ